MPWEANNRPSHTTSRAVSNCGIGVSGTPSSGIQYWPVRGRGRTEGEEGRREEEGWKRKGRRWEKGMREEEGKGQSEVPKHINSVLSVASTHI